MKETKGQETHLYNLRKMKLRLTHSGWMLSFNQPKKDRPLVNESITNVKLIALCNNSNVFYCSMLHLSLALDISSISY